MAESKHFKDNELACKHCGVNGMDEAFLLQLEALREEFGHPITISSGYRCSVHNKSEGGVKGSYHLLGRAVDAVVPKAQRHFFLQLAFKYFSGIGIHPEFTHIDNREDVKVVFFYR